MREIVVRQNLEQLGVAVAALLKRHRQRAVDRAPHAFRIIRIDQQRRLALARRAGKA
jgi:hypothetical protein